MRKRLAGLSVATVLIGLPVLVRAANSYQVNANSSVNIDEYGTCRTVTNSNSKAMMVATNSSTAWSNFLAHIPPSVSAAPCLLTMVQEAETNWSSTALSKTTASFNVQVGDVLVAYSSVENGSQAALSISGGSLTWTLRQSVHTGGGDADVSIWTAVANANTAMTVTFTAGNTNVQYGGNVLTFRNSGGVGASSATSAVGGPNLNLTTTQANSAIVFVSGDWNAVNGSSRTYRTGAGAFTEQTYSYTNSRYTVYGGYHANAGAIGTYAVGVSAPTGQRFSIAAIEIKGL